MLQVGFAANESSFDPEARAKRIQMRRLNGGQDDIFKDIDRLGARDTPEDEFYMAEDIQGRLPNYIGAFPKLRRATTLIAKIVEGHDHDVELNGNPFHLSECFAVKDIRPSTLFHHKR